MKKKSIFILVLVLYSTLVLGQDTTHHYVNVLMIAIPSTICLGDTTTISTGTTCICGSPKHLNINDAFVNSCDWECEVAGSINPTIQGDNIVWHSSPPTPSCSGVDYTPSCKVSPQDTTTYTVSWDKVYTMEEGYCFSNVFPAKTIIWHYSGQVTVNVDLVPIPNLSVDKTEVNPNETFTLDNPGGCPYGVELKEECDYGGFNPTFCSNFPRTYSAPNYNTELGYKARHINIATFCESEWSDIVKINVVSPQDTSACNNNQLIKDIENAINEVDENVPPSQQPVDYHSYSTQKRLCSDCDLNQKWTEYIGNARYTLPQAQDMPAESFLIRLLPGSLKWIEKVNSPNEPIVDCGSYNLISPVNTAVKLSPYVLRKVNPVAGQALFSALEISCPGFFGNTSVFADPVMVVVDESSKCITRYTKPGHILYPGKTTTCLYENDCGEIEIRTTGKGRHFCGESLAGSAFSSLNEFAGKLIFESNHNRFGDTTQSSNLSTQVSSQSITSTNNSIVSETWVVESHGLVFNNNTDTLLIYDIDSTNNLINLSKILMIFSGQDIYTGKNIHDEPITGNYSVNGNEFHIDEQTSTYTYLDENHFELSYQTNALAADTNFYSSIATTTFRKISSGCDATLSVNSNPINSDVFKAADFITSNGVILEDSIVIFEAGEMMIFEPGFHSKTTSNLIAQIAPCNSNTAVFSSPLYSETILQDDKINNTKSDLGIEIYPNPTDGIFYVKNSFSEDGVLSIFDITGQLLQSFQLNQGELKYELPNSSGMYILKIRSGDSIVLKKILKY